MQSERERAGREESGYKVEGSTLLAAENGGCWPMTCSWNASSSADIGAVSIVESREATLWIAKHQEGQSLRCVQKLWRKAHRESRPTRRPAVRSGRARAAVRTKADRA